MQITILHSKFLVSSSSLKYFVLKCFLSQDRLHILLTTNIFILIISFLSTSFNSFLWAKRIAREWEKGEKNHAWYMIPSDSLETRCSKIVYWLLMQIDFMRIVKKLHELKSRKRNEIFHGVSFTRIYSTNSRKTEIIKNDSVCEVYEKQGGKNTNLLEFSFFSSLSLFLCSIKEKFASKNLVHGWEQKRNRLGKLRRNLWKHLSCVSWTVLISTIFCHEPPS